MTKQTKYEFDKYLDAEKVEAIKHTDGPLLIIAGPGSGKTKTLVEKVVYLVLEKGLKAEEILIATFTQKAASELITRISNRIIDCGIKFNLNEMYIGTLHSIFLRILEENRIHTDLSRNYRMLDDFELNYLIYENIKRFEEIENCRLILGEKEETSNWTKSERVLKNVSKISKELLDIKELKKSEDAVILALAEFYE
ncbi:MAG: UvrD-helicase domain-containing protein [Candidatus Kapabacteria bacterium]|nr:UvrD-helicase domain-containing protein [Candidatus Kapabacteria bacterium]